MPGALPPGGGAPPDSDAPFSGTLADLPATVRLDPSNEAAACLPLLSRQREILLEQPVILGAAVDLDGVFPMPVAGVLHDASTLVNHEAGVTCAGCARLAAVHSDLPRLWLWACRRVLPTPLRPLLYTLNTSSYGIKMQPLTGEI